MDVGSGKGCENLKVRENRRVSLEQFEQINERTISTACGRKGNYARVLLSSSLPPCNSGQFGNVTKYYLVNSQRLLAL